MNETEITLDQRVETLLLKVSDDTLLGLSRASLEAIGRHVSAAFIRRQNDLLCKRDGHTLEDEHALFSGVCQRCCTVIDLPKWEALKAEMVDLAP